MNEYIIIDDTLTYIEYIQRIEILQKDNIILQKETIKLNKKLNHNNMLINEMINQLHPKRIRILEKQFNISLFHLKK